MVKDKKSILLISHELSNTGAPILCRHISAELKNRGYETAMISLCRGKVTEQVRSSAKKVHVVNIRHSYIKKALRMVNNNWGKEESVRLEALVRRYKAKGYRYAIVNSMESGSIVPYLKKQGYRIITLVHEMSSVYEKFNAYYKLENIAKYSDVIVFPGNAVKKDFESAIDERIKGRVAIFSQGVYKEGSQIIDYDIARKALVDELGLEKDSQFIVGSGAIAMIKGVDLVPLIMDKLREEKNLHFLWLGGIGEKQYEITLRHQIKRMKLEHKIHFLGFVDDAKKYNNIMCGSKCFVLTSREDPMPSVMAEAMAMKLPVVAFKGSGGAEELLAEGRGYLANYCNTDEMAEIIKRIMRYPDETDITKETAYSYVKKNMNFGDYVEKILNHLEYFKD